VDTFEGFAELDIGELIEGVEVRADCAGEKDRILRDDRKTGTQVLEFDGRDIDSIDNNTAFSGFKESEKRERQC
jgi:hypothetical protein